MRAAPLSLALASLPLGHGAEDPNVPAKDVAAFQEETRKAKTDYTFIAFGSNEFFK